MSELPMFPLGTVLLPSMVIPLHIFEERYRVLVRHCLDGDRRFGVVLIERGSEVGGGEVRTEIGTVAEIIEVARFDDGRFALAAVGTERIRVTSWLPDDPYPRAQIEPWPDPIPPDTLQVELDAVMARLRRLLARLSELGHAVAPATTPLDDDLVLASYQAAAIAPFGPADRQRLLVAPTTADRLQALADLIDEEQDALDRIRQLGSPDDGGPVD